MGIFNKKETAYIKELENKLKKANETIVDLNKQLESITKKYNDNLKFIEDNNIKDYEQVINQIAIKKDEIMNLRIEESNYRCKIKELTEQYDTLKRNKENSVSINVTEEIKTNSTTDGFYNFSEVSNEENNQIIYFISASKGKGSLAGLHLIDYTLNEYLYKVKYYIEQIVIEKYKSSDNLYDWLAVGLAYKGKGANFRKESLFYLTKFVSTANNTDWNNILSIDMDLDKYNIYSKIAELYEKEADLENAYNYAMKACEFRIYADSGMYRLGSILKKLDINKCVEYYKEKLTDPRYKEIKNGIKKELNDALEKQKKNYVYRPRKRKSTIDENMENNLKEIADRYLKYF
ncbi:hypothetical protein [Longibaculum muris]|uniref:hypothetical protein n=1 Tax=Longibaculum muris TaxID=1796628 RepID=UPI0022E7DE6D|nr:hypothetical protein [Longibaculum muris]